MEGIPHHLWSINLFYRMVGDFAELLDVDLSIDQVKFQGYARVKIRLHMGKSLPEVRYYAFTRNVYPIQFYKSWDLCPLASSS